jgi:hypothetical protein
VPTDRIYLDEGLAGTNQLDQDQSLTTVRTAANVTLCAIDTLFRAIIITPSR